MWFRMSVISLNRLRYASGRGLCILVLAVLSVCTEAPALMVPLATTTLVDRASCIVEGRVSEVNAHWTEDRSGIVTEVTLDVTEALLGATNRVTFLYQGGTVDGIMQHVSDMPVVTNGQQVLVFLRQPKASAERRRRLGLARETRPVLVGSAQGLWRIGGGRAVKDGFTVTGDESVIERDVDTGTLKNRVRQRLSKMNRSGGTP